MYLICPPAVLASIPFTQGPPLLFPAVAAGTAGSPCWAGFPSTTSTSPSVPRPACKPTGGPGLATRKAGASCHLPRTKVVETQLSTGVASKESHGAALVRDGAGHVTPQQLWQEWAPQRECCSRWGLGGRYSREAWLGCCTGPVLFWGLAPAGQSCCLLFSWLPCSCCLWPEDGWGPELSCLQAPPRLCFTLPSPKCYWILAASCC